MLALAVVAGPGMTSQAVLRAESTLGTFGFTGATVHDPLGPLLLESLPRATASSAAINPIGGTWGAPATALAGAAAYSYEVQRRVDTGAANEPAWQTITTTFPAATRFVDPNAAACERYDYRVRAAYLNLRSVGAVQSSIVNDQEAPTVGVTLVEAVPSGAASGVSGYVRPGHTFYVYAQVNDDCGLADGMLTADLSAFGGPTAAPLQARDGGAGRWTRDGISFNFRAGPFTAGTTLADGSTAWTIATDDGRGNRASASGAAAIVDGTGPTGALDAISDTGWYAGAHGSIRPLGGFRVYADVTDAGVGLNGAVHVDASRVAWGAGAAALDAGSYPVQGRTWSLRSQPLVARFAGGSQRTMTITAVDRLGNASTITAPAYVDDVQPRLTSCSMSSADHLWGAPDTTTLTFSEPINPADAIAGWDGAGSSVINAVARDGVILPDIMEHDGVGTFGVYSLGRGWVSGGPVTFGGTTLSRSSDTTFVITYGAASRELVIPTGATPRVTIGGGLRDAAGNFLQWSSVACTIAAGAEPLEAAPNDAAPLDAAPPNVAAAGDSEAPLDTEQPVTTDAPTQPDGDTGTATGTSDTDQINSDVPTA